jgi:outer membrane protein TolC
MRIPWLLFVLPAPVCLAQAPFPPGMPAPRATQPASLAVEVSPAQRPSGSLDASIPQGKASSEPLILTIRDAIGRGLKYNLALVETGEAVQVRRAQRLRALSALLPNVSVRPSVSEQQTNLAAFGLSGFPGLPTIVGPFTIYDARASATQSLLNFQNLRNLRAARESVRAAEFSSRDIREEVVLAVTGLYLQAVAGLARIEAHRAQVSTADTAHRQAVDRKSAGTIAGIDVLRAQVELQSEQQRLYYYEGEFDKQKLDLARAIGLPPGQAIELEAMPPYAPLADGVTLESALDSAYRQRADYRAAESLVRAAELAKGAAQAGRLPTADLNGNYGVIGPSLTQMHGSFTVIGGVDIPLFQGGRVKAEVELADSALRQRKAELESLRGSIDADIRRSFTDVRSSERRVQVARQTIELARQELTQAQDRFAAGVTNNLEVVQAQQALAAANDNYISSLFAFNAAKATLIRAQGDAERSMGELLGRQK